MIQTILKCAFTSSRRGHGRVASLLPFIFISGSPSPRLSLGSVQSIPALHITIEVVESRLFYMVCNIYSMVSRYCHWSAIHLYLLFYVRILTIILIRSLVARVN